MTKRILRKSLDECMPLSLQLAKVIKKPEHRANPFVNILNQTTKVVQQYPDLLGSRSLFWRFCHSLAGAMMVLLRSMLYFKDRIRLSPIKEKPDVIIISHLTNILHLEQKKDFYFGRLADCLEESGFSAHTLLINHAKAGSEDILCSCRKKTTILPAYLSPFEEWKIFSRLFLSALTLPKIGFNRYEKRFRRLAQLAQFSSRAIGDFRIGSMITKSIFETQPKVIIYTFEGHGWERIVATTAHSLHEPLHVIGCQHAVLFPGDKSLLHDHLNGAFPDHVFTTGKITKVMLEKESDLPANKISIVGSCKAPDQLPYPEISFDGACLVAPEGTMHETLLMAEMVINVAKLKPNHKFILRLHPVMPRQKTERAIHKISPLPSNFSISSASLSDDLIISSTLCYRGSSVALEGILNGLMPIYLDPDNNISNNDPLPAKLSFRKIATSPEKLGSIISENNSIYPEVEDEFTEAYEFAQNYFSPFNSEAIISHIKSVLP